MAVESIVGRFVLIADDLALAATALARAVSYLRNLEVVTFTAGPEALSYCETRRPMLALLDVRMPQMDGVTLARRLRGRYPRLPVVFTTASPHDVDLEGLRDELGGAIVMVRKPYDLPTLRTAIDAALTRHDGRGGSA